MRYPTIVIHGFLANALTNLPIHYALRRKGFDTHDVPLPGLNTIDIPSASEMVAEKVNEVLGNSEAKKVNLIGVSKGGVIALNYLRHHNGHDVTHKAITLGSPLNGSSFIEVVKKLPKVGKKAAEMLPYSDFMKKLHAPTIKSTRQAEIISIYADGDFVVNKEAATIPEARMVKAPTGNWPLGHYQLVIDPKNLSLIADELIGPHRNQVNQIHSLTI